MPSRSFLIKDAFKSHPVHMISHNHPDLNALRELPDSYAWTNPDPTCGDQSKLLFAASEGVPVIDLTHPDAAALVGRASEKWGVFQVTNHGVPLCLLRDIEAIGRALFTLPVAQKLKAARSPEGVSGYGRARISSFFSKLMWSEGFTIVGSPLNHFRQLWPDKDHIQFCDVIEEYEAEVKRLSGRLMWLMLGSLGITRSDIQWAGPDGDFGSASSAMQMNSYPACPDPDRAMGLAAHTDSTLLTILHQSSTSGLQVHQERAGWVTVPPVPGALVVHVGDLLHILSNGIYPSVLHRAMVNRTQHRLSVAYLYGPPQNVEISPLLRLVGPEQPPLYRPVTWSEYLGTKAKHFNEALFSVRLSSSVSNMLDGTDRHKVHDQFTRK